MPVGDPSGLVGHHPLALDRAGIDRIRHRRTRFQLPGQALIPFLEKGAAPDQAHQEQDRTHRNPPCTESVRRRQPLLPLAVQPLDKKRHAEDSEGCRDDEQGGHGTVDRKSRAPAQGRVDQRIAQGHQQEEEQQQGIRTFFRPPDCQPRDGKDSEPQQDPFKRAGQEWRAVQQRNSGHHSLSHGGEVRLDRRQGAFRHPAVHDKRRADHLGPRNLDDGKIPRDQGEETQDDNENTRQSTGHHECRAVRSLAAEQVHDQCVDEEYNPHDEKLQMVHRQQPHQHGRPHRKRRAALRQPLDMEQARGGENRRQHGERRPIHGRQ